MASEINQILPIALGTVAHSSPQVSSLAKSASVGTLKDIPQTAQQILAANAAPKINSKEQGVQVPKRSEPNFASDDDKSQQGGTTYLKKGKRGVVYSKGSSNPDLDLVA